MMDKRFFKYVAVSSRCWEWTGSRDQGGYGRYQYNGRSVAAHRIAFGILAIPPGFEVDHLCRNRSCVRPLHLEAVPAVVNKRRARKTRCLRGHLLEENALTLRAGGRRCLACKRDYERNAARVRRAISI